MYQFLLVEWYYIWINHSSLIASRLYNISQNTEVLGEQNLSEDELKPIRVQLQVQELKFLWLLSAIYLMEQMQWSQISDFICRQQAVNLFCKRPQWVFNPAALAIVPWLHEAFVETSLASGKPAEGDLGHKERSSPCHKFSPKVTGSQPLTALYACTSLHSGKLVRV